MLCCLFRKPLKTTRILAELAEDTSGTELYYTSDGVSDMRDTLLSQYELGNLELGPSPALTGLSDDDRTIDGDDAVDDNEAADVDGPAAAGTTCNLCICYLMSDV